MLWIGTHQPLKLDWVIRYSKRIPGRAGRGTELVCTKAFSIAQSHGIQVDREREIRFETLPDFCYVVALFFWNSLVWLSRWVGEWRCWTSVSFFRVVENWFTGRTNIVWPEWKNLGISWLCHERENDTPVCPHEPLGLSTIEKGQIMLQMLIDWPWVPRKSTIHVESKTKKAKP